MSKGKGLGVVVALAAAAIIFTVLIVTGAVPLSIGSCGDKVPVQLEDGRTFESIDQFKAYFSFSDEELSSYERLFDPEVRDGVLYACEPDMEGLE